jgi:hypothetical protein
MMATAMLVAHVMARQRQEISPLSKYFVNASGFIRPIKPRLERIPTRLRPDGIFLVFQLVGIAIFYNRKLHITSSGCLP